MLLTRGALLNTVYVNLALYMHRKANCVLQSVFDEYWMLRMDPIIKAPFIVTRI